jgi:glutaconate CoA-transferase subunit B
MPHSKRGMVERIDFVTSIGHGSGGDARARLGIRTEGPVKVITDLCIMEPDPETKELTVTSLHPRVSKNAVAGATGWPVQFSDTLTETPEPAASELEVLRTLRAETARAHGAA